MRISISTKLLLMACFAGIGCRVEAAAQAQASDPTQPQAVAQATPSAAPSVAPSVAPKTHPLELALTYDATRSNVTTGSSFWLNGGGLEAHGQFWRGLGAVADVAAAHSANINGSGANNGGVGLDLVTATFGPRYTLTLPHSSLQARYTFFGQALAGEAFALHSTFPARSNPSASANGLATLLGGGVNVTLSRRFTLRAAQADWLRTQAPNATDGVQNSLRLGAGIVFRLP